MTATGTRTITRRGVRAEAGSRRARVVATVEALHAEHPHRPPTNREVAERAGLAHSTVWHHVRRAAEVGELRLLPSGGGGLVPVPVVAAEPSGESS